jgi:hypothetical protein
MPDSLSGAEIGRGTRPHEAPPLLAIPGPAKHPVFESLLNDDAVDLLHLVEAKVMSSPGLTQDEASREIGEHFYPLLRSSFEKKHKGVQLVIQEDVGAGLALHTGADNDPKGDVLDTFIIRKTFRFDWSAPRVLMEQSNALAGETVRWITNPAERRALLGLIFGILSQIDATLARENRQCPVGQHEGVKPTARIDTDLKIIGNQLEAAQRLFERDTQRAAQFRYAAGMAYGVVIMTLLCAAIGGVFLATGARATGGVALAAGAVGACVSVLQRMTKGTLELNAQAGHKMIYLFGALRPFVGGIFGVIIYFVIRAELVSVFVLPQEAQKALAYVAVFAFVAGFNERFFQDMLASASSARTEE